tara:strand:+ start:11642 stop:14284 length:2643 start_codon:yes stop_codon:yes gene_type:complete
MVNKMDYLLEEQKRLEQQMYDGGVNRWHSLNQRAVDSGEASSTDWNVKLTKNFINPLSQAIDAYVNEHEGKSGRFSDTLNYMGCVDSREAAFITIRQVFNAIAIHKSTSVQVLSVDIASKIEDQVRFSELKKTPKSRAYIAKIKKTLDQAASRQYKHKKNVWVNAERKVGKDRWTAWTKAKKIHFGSSLVKLACQVLFVDDEPILYLDEVDISRGKLRKSSKVVGITGKYADYVSQFITNTEAFHPEVAPCVVPPRDWTSPSKGGFHSAKIAVRNPLIKTKDKSIAAQMTTGQMPKVYKAVNALQNTQWKVNDEVLAVVQEVVTRGLDLAVPSAECSAIPCNPFEGREDLAELKGEDLKNAVTREEYDAFITWKRDKREWHDAERSRVSNVIDLARTMKLAMNYAKYDAMYFVYSLDFRGRVYARASGLSPQGRDLQKGLLRFSRVKKLGKNGHYWLKIHGANLYGHDKLPFNERVEKVGDPEFIEMVHSIADAPLANREWVGADKPWQFLSWCMEYSDFLRFVEDGGKAKDYESFIACAQDGSCSGIQHYSAMLRDEVGGKAVNLIDSDEPQDIYNDVCKEVMKWLEVVAKGEHPKPLHEDTEEQALSTEKWEDEVLYAQQWLLMGFDRELCKKPVMTLPYGSSRLTCRDAVGIYIDDCQKKENGKAKAEEREPQLVHNFGDRRWEAEGFMSSVVWDSIGLVVIAAREGMAFIRRVARDVARKGFPLVWTTPTGFIIKQEVFKTTEHTINTCLFGRIQFKVYEDSDVLDTRKQQSGAAPNFIHGNDAAHLVLSICEGVDAGIKDFWVVHDDFGTHAAKTGHLQIALRGSMCDMYQEDILREFLWEQEDRNDTNFKLDKEVPDMGELDLQEIKNSKYIFS